MKYQKSLILLAGLLLLSMALAACGGSGSSEFPTGTFIKSGTDDYGITFNEGNFSVSSGGATLVTGTYSVDGNTFTETSNDGGCDSPVSFTYTFDGTNLTFNYVDDPAEDSCEGRRSDFNNVTYTLSK